MKKCFLLFSALVVAFALIGCGAAETTKPATTTPPAGKDKGTTP